MGQEKIYICIPEREYMETGRSNQFNARSKLWKASTTLKFQADLVCVLQQEVDHQRGLGRTDV